MTEEKRFPGLRISIIGLSGAGKTTGASLIREIALEKGLTCARLKIAEPLYDLQRQVYRRAGGTLREGEQDQALMEALASAMRRIRAQSLADDFVRRLGAVEADVIVNDDLRDPDTDAPALRARGFRFLRVICDENLRRRRLRGRRDLTRSDDSTRRIDLIEPDAVIDNGGDLGAYRDAVRDVLESWL